MDDVDEDRVDGHVAPLPLSADAEAEPVSLDCDSEELEALEDEADVEDADEADLDRIVDEAALLYPPERVAAMLSELKQGGLVRFMQLHVEPLSPVQIKALMVAMGVLVPRTLRENSDVPAAYWKALLKTTLVRHLRRRDKLNAYNTVDDVVALLARSKKVMVLGGAGMSTSCGIPDFRSKDGIYAQLQREGRYDLADPQDMFDKDFFLHDPSLFFGFARAIFPSNFVPSTSHRFVKLLEQRGILLRHYTQNIDTLEQAAGIERVLHCHGSFSRAACTTPGCTYEVAGSEIKEAIFAQEVPRCPRCQQAEVARRQAIRASSTKKANGKAWDEDDGEDDRDAELPGMGVLKPCITFFGEALSDDFGRAVVADREQVDLLLVMGTSLKVAPVSELVGHIPHTTPVVLINRTPVTHLAMDVQLLGDGDTIVEYLCRKLEWQLPLPQPTSDVVGEQSAAADLTTQVVEEGKKGKVAITEVAAVEPQRVGDSHFWLFPGAEADELLEILAEDDDDDNDDEVEEDDDDGHDQDEVKQAEKSDEVPKVAPVEQHDHKRTASTSSDAAQLTLKHSRLDES